MKELNVIRVLFKGRNWDSIRQLFTERVYCVIHKKNVFQMNVFENSQVFDILTVFTPYARWTVKPLLNQLPGGVKVVQNCVSIKWGTSCEHTYFIVFVRRLKELLTIWTDIEPSFDGATRWSGEIQVNVRFAIWVWLFDAMCKCLVQIQQKKFPNMWFCPFEFKRLLINLIDWYFQIL